MEAEGAQQPVIDLCREGTVDSCVALVARKISDPAFWTGAEQMLAKNPPTFGYPEVRETLSRHIHQLFGVSLRWEDLLLVPSQFAALRAFALAFCSARDIILWAAPFADPELPSLLSACTGVELRAIQQVEQGLALSGLENTVRGLQKDGRRVRALLLHNPHPLLGCLKGGDRQLARLLEWTAERALYLLVDESMASLDLWEFSSALTLDHRGQLGQRLVWLWSGAKHLSLPGLEFAALLFSHNHSERVRHFVHATPCAPLVQFLSAKLLENFDWISELFATQKSRLDELRQLVVRELTGMGAERTLDEMEMASQWVLADFSQFLTESTFESECTLREEIAHRGGLLLISGEQLGMAEAGWFRLRIGEWAERTSEIMNRLKRVFEGKRRRESIADWEKMDMSKYGGKGIAWDQVENGGATDEGNRMVEEMEEDESRWRERGGREGDEQREERLAEVPERDWALDRREVGRSLDDKKRLTMVKEEEQQQDKGREEMDVLDQVFSSSRREEINRCRTLNEEEEHDILQRVFSVFPADRLSWRKPLTEKGGEEDSTTAENMKALRGGREGREAENGKTAAAGHGETKAVRFLEDIQDGLDAERGRGRRERSPPKSQQKPAKRTVVSALTDLSFIEELVRGGESWSRAEERGRQLQEGEFYDEASTEEEEAEKRSGEEEFQLIGGRQQQVTGRGSAEKEEDENDPKRIIEIIDRIFHEAVEIREYPTQQRTGALWSRSDSGLADSRHSLRDLSISPLPTADYHLLDSIAERTTADIPLEQMVVDSPDFTRNEEAMLLVESPFLTSTLLRDTGGSRWAYEDRDAEQERVLGPAAQMLDDSGIFVEMPPGTLSIDFPLLVPIVPAMMNEREEKERGGEAIQREQQQQKDELLERGREGREQGGGLTVELQFKTVISTASAGEVFTEEELRRIVAGDDRRPPIGEKTAQKEDEEEELEWIPLENVEPTRIEVVDRDRGMDEQQRLEKEAEEREKQERLAEQIQLAALLSEGSAFCPSPTSPPVTPSGEWLVRSVESAADERGQRVQVWTPLGQMENQRLERSENEEEGEMEEQDGQKQQGKKFSEELDALERREMEEEEVEEEKTVGGGLGQEGHKKRGKKSWEAADVVAEWNQKVVGTETSRRGLQKEKESEKVELQMDLAHEGKREATEYAEVTLIDQQMPRRMWEEWAGKEAEWSKVDEARTDEQGRIKTVVSLGPAPKKPLRVGLEQRRMEEAERQELLPPVPFAAETHQHFLLTEKKQAEEEEMKEDGLAEIPGRAKGGHQVHQRMQMRRRPAGEEKGRRQRRTKSRDPVVIEHMNITELDYRGRGLSERVERGERLVTSISTRINRFTPDELFWRLPIGGRQAGSLLEENSGGERLRKYVETRRTRSQSVPSVWAGGKEGPAEEKEGERRTETNYLLIRRVDSSGREEENQRDQQQQKEEKEEQLCCRLSPDRRSKQQQMEGEERGNEQALDVQYLVCRNPEHSNREDHCDPRRMYRLRRCTQKILSAEDGHKRLKRERETTRAEEDDPAHQQLHSRFETVHYEWTDPPSAGGDGVEAHREQQQRLRRRTRASHKYKRPKTGGAGGRQSPSRITVTTQRSGQAESIDRVTVKHTPHSNWIVSSLYRSTEYGWERRAMTMDGRQQRERKLISKNYY